MTSPAAIATTKKMDARVIKTLKSIEQSFLNLLAQKTYDDITVQDILDKAVINRTTFYKYYTNKTDLAQQMVNALKQNLLIPMLDMRLNTPWEEVGDTIHRAFGDHRETLRLLWRIESPKCCPRQDFYALFKEKYIQSAQTTLPKPSARELDFQAHLYASFGTAMLCYVIADDSPDDARMSAAQIYDSMQAVFHKIMH